MTRKQQKRSTLAEFADWLAKTKLPKLDQNGPWDHDAIGEGIAAGALPEMKTSEDFFGVAVPTFLGEDNYCAVGKYFGITQIDASILFRQRRATKRQIVAAIRRYVRDGKRGEAV